MLGIFDGEQGISRRRLLTIGSLGLGGLSLPTLYAAGGSGDSESNPVTGRSVIFLFQQGGPSQFETFDPKPDAPSGIRTVTDVIPTTIPGGTLLETLVFETTVEKVGKDGLEVRVDDDTSGLGVIDECDESNNADVWIDVPCL